MMGQEIEHAWPELAALLPLFKEVRATGKASAVADSTFFIERYGYLEE